jgi:hypothetical protein
MRVSAGLFTYFREKLKVMERKIQEFIFEKLKEMERKIQEFIFEKLKVMERLIKAFTFLQFFSHCGYILGYSLFRTYPPAPDNFRS